MAETLGGLYLRLGLSISELESGFLDAERTVQQNMARLSRQQNLIRLRAEVEIGNLDETADAAQILTVRTQALNQQLSVQRDRIRIAEANLRDMTQRYGENAVLTQRAAVALERERVQLQRFERDLREVERAQRDLNDSQDESTGNLENFSEALNGLARKAVAVATVAEIFDKISESVAESKEKLRELQNQSYELNLPIDETKEFLRQLKLAGGDIGDFEGYIRGITDAYVKGEWDDPEFLALSKHGAQITDATGRLKDFKGITEEVYQAYLKAKDAGEEIEFLQLTGGEAGVRDAIQFFERYKEAKEDAAKVFNADLDAKAFHELDRTMGLVEEQSDELKNAIANIFTPAINASARSFFEILRDGTKILTENKEEFKSWGFIAAEAVNTVLDPLKELKNATLNFGDKQADERYKNFLADYNKNLEDYSSHNPFRDYWSWAFGEMFGGVIGRATEKQIEYNNAVKGTTASWADFRREEETALNNDTVLSQYGMKRIQQFKDELEDLRIEIDFGDSDYDKKIAETELWLQRELTDKLQVSLEEETAIRELYAAKIEQIEQEKEDKLNEIREQAERARRTDLENALADIESEKEKRINAGMEAAEAIRMAAEESAAAIKILEDAFTEKVNSFRNNALQNQFAAIDKDRDSWIKQGIDPEQANAFASEQKYKALQDLEESFSQRINEIRGNDLEKQLARIEQEKQAWIDKGIEETRAEELAASQKEQIFKDYAEKQQQAQERYKEQVKQREEQIAKAIEEYWKRVAESIERQFDEALSVLKSQLDAFKAYRDGGIKGLEEYERKQLKKQGITDKDLQSMTKDRLEDFKQAQKDVKRNLLPNFQPVNDVPFPELPPPIEPPEAFDDLNEKLYQTTDALESFKNALSSNSDAPNYAEDADGNRYDLDDIHNTPNYTPQYDSSDFNTDLNQSVTDALSGLGANFSDVNDKLAEITQLLSDIVSDVKNIAGNSDNRSQPVNVNVTVQIEEAHAWDSRHIQELSDRVADAIAPQIVNAIGGDSNGY